MVCPYCRNATQVVNSRSKRHSNSIWRRRRCTICGSVVSTEETLTYTTTLVVKDTSGELAPFSRDKVMISLYKSLAHRPTAISDAAALSETLIGQLHANHNGPTIEREHIRAQALVILGRFDELAGSHYRAYHSS